MAKVNFSANAVSVPSGASITYKWQAFDGEAWANVDNGGAYSNTATKVLTVDANVAATNGEVYRCGAYATGATTKFSGNAAITILPLVIIDTQPEDAEGDDSEDDVVDFTVVASTDPEGKALEYQWQKLNGEAFDNLTDTGAYSNTDTDTLSVLANTAVDGEVYRCVVMSADNNASNVTSESATLTVVA